MTVGERKQPRINFINAGRTAYKIGVEFQNNPYKEQPFRSLWEKGHTAERHHEEKTRTRFNRPAFSGRSRKAR